MPAGRRLEGGVAPTADEQSDASLSGMGELGRQAASLDRRALIQELTRAYADEWFAHYNYQFTSLTLWGHHSPATTQLLARKSAEALARANRLGERILELGGQPIRKLTDLIRHA